MNGFPQDEIKKIPGRFLPDQASFIVLDLPSPVAEMIRKLRGEYDPKRVLVPVEITLTGSSGLGAVSPGQDISLISEEIGQIAKRFSPFKAKFRKAETFPGSNIYFLSLEDENPFMELHKAFASSKIRFRESPFPYRPHCTLILREENHEPDFLEKLSAKIPSEEFTMEMLSFYTLPSQNECELLFKTPLGTEK